MPTELVTNIPQVLMFAWGEFQDEQPFVTWYFSAQARDEVYSVIQKTRPASIVMIKFEFECPALSPLPEQQRLAEAEFMRVARH